MHLRLTALLLAVSLPAAAAGGAKGRGPTPPAKAAPSVAERLLPDVPLMTHDGRSVRFYSDLVKDKRVIVSFTYTRCKGSCPRTTAALVALQATLGERLGRDIFAYSVTLDPEHDTPQVLKEHADVVRARPGWTFLTGSLVDIDALRRALGFTDPDPERDADRTQHAALIAFGNDRTNRWSTSPAGTRRERLVEEVGRITGLALVPPAAGTASCTPPSPAPGTGLKQPARKN